MQCYLELLVQTDSVTLLTKCQPVTYVVRYIKSCYHHTPLCYKTPQQFSTNFFGISQNKLH